MIQRTCLLIDDSDQSDVFPTIQREGKKYGIQIKCLQFNVGHPENREVLTDEQIDVNKVIDVFQQRFKGEKIDLLAFDWNLSSTTINGPLLIRAFTEKEIRSRVPKILYSGILKDEVQRLCDNYRQDKSMPFKVIWAQVNTLISSGILTFVSRDDYEIAVVEQLRRIDDTIDISMEELLRNFPEVRFQNRFVSDQFQDLSFLEIADIIDRNRNLRNALTKEITQQVIAFLAERI